MPTLAPNAGGNAFQLGWVMAGLYGRFSRAHDRSAGHLPTLGELDATDRMRLAVMEVTVRLEQLRPAIDIPGTVRPSASVLVAPYQTEGFHAAVHALHVDILGALQANAPGLATAYSLGRVLSDSCWQPHDRLTVCRELERERVRELLSWMDDVRTVVPPEAAQAVATSLSWWSQWVTAFGRVRGGWDIATTRVLAAWCHQGEHWRMLLSDEETAQTVLTLDGYVLAAESALLRVRHALRCIVLRFWGLITFLLAVTAWLVWLAFTHTSGEGKVWSTFVTVAVGLGVTGGSVRAALQKVATTAGKPVWAISQGEAIAAEITRFPAFDLGIAKRLRLRNRGVVAPLVAKGTRPKVFGDRTTTWRGPLPPATH